MEVLTMVDEKGTIFTLSNKSKTEYLNAIIGKTYIIILNNYT